MSSEQCEASNPIATEEHKAVSIHKRIEELEAICSDKSNQITMLKDLIAKLHDVATRKSPSGGV